MKAVTPDYKGYTTAQLIDELFSFLDAKEESELGREFYPTQISSCRVMVGLKLGALLPELQTRGGKEIP